MRQQSPSSGTPSSINPQWRIGIVRSAYYPELINALRDGAVQALIQSGIDSSSITHYAAPGSFEIPLIGRHLAEIKAVDALIALGIIVQGETHHAELLASETARGIMDVQLRYGIPFAFEILFVGDIVQAKARLNKGGEAARAVLSSLAVLHA